MGDFHEVWDESERMGYQFHPKLDRSSNQFIYHDDLIDIPWLVLGLHGVINGGLNLVSWIDFWS